MMILMMTLMMMMMMLRMVRRSLMTAEEIHSSARGETAAPLSHMTPHGRFSEPTPFALRRRARGMNHC